MSRILLFLHKLVVNFTHTPSICCLLTYYTPLSIKGNTTYSITFHLFYSIFFSASMYTRLTFLILVIVIILSFFRCDLQDILFARRKLIFYRQSHNFSSNAADSWQVKASPFTEYQQIT